jgi:hypothetical protein
MRSSDPAVLVLHNLVASLYAQSSFEAAMPTRTRLFSRPLELTSLQPFLAARHGFLLNADGSSEDELERNDGLFGREEGSVSETEVGLLRTDDGLLETEDESLVETGVGLLETDYDSSFRTEDGCLFETEDGWLETEDEGLLGTEDDGLFEEGDGLSTRDDTATGEAEEEHFMVVIPGFLDNVGVVGLEEGVLSIEAGLGQA